jgi:hypothetical protein
MPQSGAQACTKYHVTMGTCVCGISWHNSARHQLFSFNSGGRGVYQFDQPKRLRSELRAVEEPSTALIIVDLSFITQGYASRNRYWYVDKVGAHIIRYSTRS